MKSIAIIGLCILAASVGGQEIFNSYFYQFEGETAIMSCPLPSWPEEGSVCWHYWTSTDAGVLTLYDYFYITDETRLARYELVEDYDAYTTTVTINNLNIADDSGTYKVGHYSWTDGWTQWYCGFGMAVFPESDRQYEGECNVYAAGDEECDTPSLKTFLCNSACMPPIDCSSAPYVRCGPLPEDEVNEVLNAHNGARQLIASGADLSDYGASPQPIGTDIYELEYDYVIGALAEGWAEQDIWAHDCGYCRQGSALSVYSSMGQNMAWMGTLDYAWTHATDMWFSEVANYDYDTNSAIEPGLATGHYTQVIWSSSKFLGCGVLQGDWEEFNYGVFVCNYYPAGNWVGSKPYSTTEQCPNGTSDVWPNLCKH